MNKLSKAVSNIAIRMFLIDFLKCFFVAFALYFLAQYLFRNPLVSLVFGAIAFLGMSIYLKLWQTKKNTAKVFVHQYNPKLEHSLSLLEKPTLNVIEEMQLDRILETKIKLPLKLDKAFWLMLLAAILSVGFTFIPKKISLINTKII